MRLLTSLIPATLLTLLGCGGSGSGPGKENAVLALPAGAAGPTVTAVCNGGTTIAGTVFVHTSDFIGSTGIIWQGASHPILPSLPVRALMESSVDALSPTGTFAAGTGLDRAIGTFFFVWTKAGGAVLLPNPIGKMYSSTFGKSIRITDDGQLTMLVGTLPNGASIPEAEYMLSWKPGDASVTLSARKGYDTEHGDITPIIPQLRTGQSNWNLITASQNRAFAAGDVSVAGDRSETTEAAIWNAGGQCVLVNFPFADGKNATQANAVSDDGTTVIGVTGQPIAPIFTSMYWTSQTGIHKVDDLGFPGGTIDAVSPDGKYVVGETQDNINTWNVYLAKVK